MADGIMELDVKQLQKDLQELEQKRQQAAERLRTLAHRDAIARGRGFESTQPPKGGRFGPAPGRGSFGQGMRGSGRRSASDWYVNGCNSYDWQERLRGGGFVGRGAYGRSASMNDRDPQNGQAPPVTKKRILSSAVVVNGEQRILGRQDDGGKAASLKRPVSLELDEIPSMRKRNRRIFDNLLSTLQRFKEEETVFQQTATAQKQAEALKRAEEKTAAERQRLRQLARQKKVSERQNELDNIRQFNLQADMKALEIIYAKKILNRQKHLSCIFTKHSPGLYWVPEAHCPETKAALQQGIQEFEKWKAEQQTVLESEKEKLREQAAAHKAAALARATQMHVAGKEVEEDAVAREEAELEKQLANTRAEPKTEATGEAAAGTKNEANVEAKAKLRAVAGSLEAQRFVERRQGDEESKDEDWEQGEEDGELPSMADGHCRRDEVEAGGDLLDKLDMETGNPDAENIEDLLQ